MYLCKLTHLLLIQLLLNLIKVFSDNFNELYNINASFQENF